MEFIRYVRGLGFTQEQLIFLAGVGLVLWTVWAVVRAFRGSFVSREARVELDALHQVAGEFALRLARLESIWNAVGDKTDVLVSQVLAGSVQAEQTTEVIERAVREMLVKLVMAKGDDRTLQAAGDRVFRETLFKAEQALSTAPTEELAKSVQDALRRAIQPWLEDEEDDDVNEAATRVFRAGVKGAEERLLAQPDTYPDFDRALVEQVTSLLESDDEDVRGLIADFGKALVTGRLTVLSTSPPVDVVAGVEARIADSVDSWLEDNDEDVVAAVGKFATAVLARQAVALAAAPPDSTVEVVNERITDALEGQLDELAAEISKAARELAKSALRRSVQAS